MKILSKAEKDKVDKEKRSREQRMKMYYHEIGKQTQPLFLPFVWFNHLRPF